MSDKTRSFIEGFLKTRPPSDSTDVPLSPFHVQEARDGAEYPQGCWLATVEMLQGGLINALVAFFEAREDGVLVAIEYIEEHFSGAHPALQAAQALREAYGFEEEES